MKKIGKVVLASAIAMGGINSIQLTKPLVTMAAIQGTTSYEDILFNESTAWTGLSPEIANNMKFTHTPDLHDMSWAGSGSTSIPNAEMRLELHNLTTGATVVVGPSVVSTYNSPPLTLTASNIVQGNTYGLYVTTYNANDNKWYAVNDGAYKSMIGEDGKFYAETVRAIDVKYSTPGANILKTDMTVTTSDDPDVVSFIPRYTIQNTSAVIVQSGTLNAHSYSEPPNTWGYGKSLTNINVSNLPPGGYRIKIYQPVTGGELKSIPTNPAFPTMEAHFDIKSDRTVYNFIVGPWKP